MSFYASVPSEYETMSARPCPEPDCAPGSDALLPKPETALERVLLHVLFGAATAILDDWYQWQAADRSVDGGEFSDAFHVDTPADVAAAQDFVDTAWRYSPTFCLEFSENPFAEAVS